MKLTAVKHTLGIITVVTIFASTMFGVFGSPSVAKANNPAATVAGLAINAVVVGIQAAIAADSAVSGGSAGTAAARTSEEVSDRLIKPMFGVILREVLINTLSYVSNRLAYDAAVALASGMTGQTPLIATMPAEEYFKNLGMDVAGQAIDSLGDSMGRALDMEFNICTPQDPIKRMGLQIGLRNAYAPPALEPRCDFQEFLNNINQIVGTYTGMEGGTQQILRRFAVAYEPGQNELSASVELNIQIQQNILLSKSIQLDEALSQDGYKNVVDVITGQIETPASLLREQSEYRLIENAYETEHLKLELVTQDKEAFAQMGLSALSVFSNALLSNLANNIFSGLFETPVHSVNPFNPISALPSGRERAREAYRDIIAPSILSFDNYNLMGEFVICPGDDMRGLNNCVMDQPFAAAVGRANTGEPMTVQQAIDEGFLNGDWPLISSRDEGRNQDPSCHTYGYCYGNLVKLRKARVIPIGWELAANSPFNDQASPVALQTVVDGFFNCNDEGKADSSHPWCHLIDASWILKAPQSQCRAFVPIELPVSSMVNARQSSCVDSPSCISQGDDGACVGGYGYCTEEKNTWRFNGDSCPAEYAGCLAFSNVRTNKSGNFLLNTVDTVGCSSDNAGCMWYRTNKYFDDKGNTDASDDTFEFLPTGEDYVVASHDIADTAYEDRLYVNQNAGICSADVSGCSELIDATNVKLNMIENPSFENDKDSDGSPDGWDVSFGVYDTTSGNGFSGTDAMGNTSSDLEIYQTNVSLSSNRFYTFSAYVKGSSTSTAIIYIDLTPDNSSDTVNLSNSTVLGDCSAAGQTVTMNLIGDDIEGSYERFTCTFTTPSFETNANLTLEAENIYLDAVQLELGSVASSFHDAYGSGSIARTYLKVAPDWLGCTGRASDPEECASYTQMCAAQDVGCSMYTPSAGGFGVPAVISSNDSCPAQCVGYETYRQEETNYEAEDFPLYFISSSARTCTQAEIGCDEYTNLNDVALGGEGLEYYSDIKFCATSQQDSGATFYTWEGTEEEGFQLRTWQLMESNLSSPLVTNYSETRSAVLTSVFVEQNVGEAPCTNSSVSADDSDVICNDAPRSSSENNTFTECNEHEDIFSNPDCREFYDGAGNIHYRLMSETVVISEDCAPYRKNVIDEDNCGNSGGHWTVGGTCRYFLLASQSASCTASAAGCRNYTGGSGRNASTIFTDTVEDGSLNEYSGLNPSVSISSESVAAGGHSIRITDGMLNTLSLVEGDSSIAVSVGGTPIADGQCDVGSVCLLEDAGGASCTVVGTDADDTDDCGTLVGKLASGKTYVLEFWARGTGSLTAYLTEDRGAGEPPRYFSDNENPLTPEVVEITPGWQLYSLGPLDTTGLSSFDDTAVLSFEIGPSSDIYLDNITLKETEENLALIKNSWVTPSICDLSSTGMPSPQNYLGCQEYKNSSGAVHDLYRFTRLCGENVIGCKAYYDTQNSESIFGQTFNATCSASASVTEPTPCMNGLETVCTIQPGEENCQFSLNESLPDPLPSSISLGPEARVVSNDIDIFLVNNGGTSCSVSMAGCTEVGKPVFNQTKTLVTGFELAYIIDDPDQYSRILCDADGLFCEAWSTGQDGTFYFKDPDTQTCEHKDSVSINNQEYSGWFRTGTDSPCYYDDLNSNGAFDATTAAEFESAYLIGGTEFGIWRNGDVDYYDGWVAQCSATYDRCSEFIDPMDTGDGLYPEGTPYVYIKNDRLEEGSQSSSRLCNETVSLNEGCALFFDSIQPELLWNASASYMVSEHADILFGDTAQSLQSPISCDGASTDAGNDIGRIITPSGTILNLCQQRCEYIVEAGVSIAHPYAESVAENSSADALLHIYTSSCVQNSDCPTLEDSNYNKVNGSCVQSFANSPSGIQQPYRKLMDDSEAILDFNDVNDVRNVDRDRECSEWITCSSTIQVWDELMGRYKTVCDQIGSCVENGNSGDVTVCTEFSDDQPAALTDDVYISRDVSWWGTDSSGYSIPNAIQTQFLDQVNINPQKWCAGEMDEDGNKIACTEATEEADCAMGHPCVDAPTDYRLAFTAGTCDSEDLSLGDSCYVGKCENSGYDCSSDGECDASTGEECLIGICVQTRKNSTCSLDTDCDPGFECVGSVCKNINTGICGPLTETSDCGPDTTILDNQCVVVDTSFIGTCYSNKCLLGADGTPFSPVLMQDNQNAIECRGFPEQNSPYPHTLNEENTGLVTQWKTFDDTSDSFQSFFEASPSNKTSVPYTQLPGYQGVEVCAPNQDCMCSYRKVGYGDGVKYRYYDQDASPGMLMTGICFGGDYEGRECVNDDECKDATASVSTGRCLKPTSIEMMLGLTGYCLERDTAMNRFDNANNLFGGQCLTWLPIDQLTGADDIYNQSTEAGVLIDENVMYCTEAALYTDLYVTGSQNPGEGNNQIANGCAESRTTPSNPTCNSNETNGCLDNTHCPKGYFAIVGECDLDLTDYAVSNNCQTCDDAYCETNAAADDNCPYFCVPDGAEDYTDGGADCNPPSDNPTQTITTQSWTTDVYGVGGNFEQKLGGYRHCAHLGVKVGIDDGEYMRLSTLAVQNPADGYWQGNTDVPYLACEEFAHVSSPTGGNKGWTNRLWSGLLPLFSLQETVTPDRLSYNPMTVPIEPYGRIESGLLEELEETPNELWWQRVDTSKPITINACTDSSYASNHILAGLVSGECSTGPIYEGESRSYEGIEAVIPDLANFGTCNNDEGCNNTICRNSIDNNSEDSKACFKLCDPSDYPADLNNGDGTYGYSGDVSGEINGMIGCYYDPDENGQASNDLGECVSLAGTNENIDLTTLNVWVCEKPSSINGCDSDDTDMGVPDLISNFAGYPGRAEYGYCTGGDYNPAESGYTQAYCNAHKLCYDQICVGTAGMKQCVPYGASIGPLTTTYETSFADNSVYAMGIVRQIFTKVLGFFTFDSGQMAYVPTERSIIEDMSEDPDAIIGPNDAGEPPSVYSLGDCFSAGCREGALNEITVNGVDGGTIEGEQGSAHVAVQFFAAADKNQMPIRNVIVDWGDGTQQSGSSSENNYYKNRRGLVDDSQTDSICDRGDAWGETTESCEPGYFTFTHDYTCTTQDVSDTGLPEYNSSSADLSDGCQSGGKCRFVPRVYIKDNWGYCTGACGDVGGPAGVMCYDDLDGTSMKNECDQENCDQYAGPSVCEAKAGQVNVVNPWISFDGVVQIEP